MFISELDWSLKPQKPKLFLAKPDRTIIASLKEALPPKQNSRLGNLNELIFSLPIMVEVRHKLVRNKNIDLIRNRYFIKLVRGNYVEWFMITKPTATMDDTKDFKTFQCLSLGIELADKLIRNYKVTSKNASQVLQDALNGTLWSIGTVDASFDVLYRSFDVSSKDVLDFIIDAATTFNALLDFDTVNRKINFYNPATYGSNKFGTISYGKLMKEVEQEENTDEFCTRLKVYGKNGTSINGVNPSGTNFIQDFSAFLYPFQRDSSKNVLSHSDYMTDSLCHALLDYQDLVASKQGQFASLLGQKNTQQSTLTTQQNALYTLENQLKTIEDQISVANYNQTDTTTLIAQKSAKQAEINTQNGLIATTNSSIAAINAQISTLQNQISVATNFNADQIKEWNSFIIEKEFTNENVDDETELLNLAIAKFEEIKQPKIVVRVNIVNLFECIELQKEWEKFGLGDIVTIRHAKLGINVQAKITEIDIDYNSGDINLIISNVRELLSDKERFLRDLYRANSTSTTVDMAKYKWDQAYQDVNDVNTILNNAWDAAARTIKASENESVEIGRKGIITTDLSDPNKYVVIQHGVIGLTKNNGDTWDTAIDANGVYAQRLIGQIIAGVNLTITNSAGNFLVNQSGVSITDLSLTVSKSDGKSRIILDPTNGIKIQSKSGTTWNDQLYADANGVLNAKSIITDSITINNSTMNNGAIVGSSINIGSGAFTVNSSGAVVASNITITGGSVQWSTIANAPAIPILPGYITSTKITSTTIESPTISAGTINGTNIVGVNITGTSTITGATIRTASSGSRLQLNSSGFLSYNNSEQLEGVVINSGNFSFIDFYYQGQLRGGLAHAAGVIQLTSAIGSIIIEASAGSFTRLRGNVDFSSANVSGLTLTFA